MRTRSVTSFAVLAAKGPAPAVLRGPGAGVTGAFARPSPCRRLAARPGRGFSAGRLPLAVRRHQAVLGVFDSGTPPLLPHAHGHQPLRRAHRALTNGQNGPERGAVGGALQSPKPARWPLFHPDPTACSRPTWTRSPTATATRWSGSSTASSRFDASPPVTTNSPILTPLSSSYAPSPSGYIENTP